jgi:hypothetical protein
MFAAAAFLIAGIFSPPGTSHFGVSARYAPPAQGQTQGSVLVTFTQNEPGVHVNEKPSPRLTLAAEQNVLDYKAPAAKMVPPADPLNAPALDLSKPVLFPVSLKPGAPKGMQSVSATVVYFYCSDREGWCRRGSEEVSFGVAVP